jgi:hypothetical protein
MKSLFTLEATSENGRSKIDQTLNGLQNAKWTDRGVGRPFLAVYLRPVQSDGTSVRGCDESDFMKSQLG